MQEVVVWGMETGYGLLITHAGANARAKILVSFRCSSTITGQSIRTAVKDTNEHHISESDEHAKTPEAFNRTP